MATKRKRSAEKWRYILQSDRALAVEQQTVWVLRPLTIEQRADVQDNLVRTHHNIDGTQTFVGRQHRLSLDLCLSNIHAVENFPAGAPEPWPEGRDARVAYLEQLDDDAVHEIGNEIYAQALLGDDIKNSSPPGRTSNSDGVLAANTSTAAPAATQTLG